MEYYTAVKKTKHLPNAAAKAHVTNMTAGERSQKKEHKVHIPFTQSDV